MYDEIIKEIKSNLTGNNEKDKAYLASQLREYADHEYGQEITREIGRMIWECLSDEEKEAFAQISEEENPVRDAFEESMYHYQNNDARTALDKLDSFFKSYPFSFRDDSVNEYHSFSNPLEEILFREYVGTDKELRFIPDNQPYVEIHHLYGFLLIEFNRLDEAERILDYAIKLNPVLTLTIFERAEIFKFKKEWDSFHEYTSMALKYAYSSSDLARAYRNLGFYFIEKNELELATALFNYSLSFEFSGNAFSELEYIKTLGRKNTISEERIMGLLEVNKIQMGPNPIIFNILAQLIMEAELNNRPNVAIYFYNILYDLTKDEEVLEKINELNDRLS